MDHDLLSDIDDADAWPCLLLDGFVVLLMLSNTTEIVLESFIGIPPFVLQAQSVEFQS